MASIRHECVDGNFSHAFAEVPRLTPLCRTLLHISEHHQLLA
jgi:hypothetical protein